jgi:hypothetical protein
VRVRGSLLPLLRSDIDTRARRSFLEAPDDSVLCSSAGHQDKKQVRPGGRVDDAISCVWDSKMQRYSDGCAATSETETMRYSRRRFSLRVIDACRRRRFNGEMRVVLRSLTRRTAAHRHRSSLLVCHNNSVRRVRSSYNIVSSSTHAHTRSRKPTVLGGAC